jgi:hypothetical protein
MLGFGSVPSGSDGLGSINRGEPLKKSAGNDPQF